MAENKAAKPVEGQSVEIKDYELRLLDADEIEVRVGQGGNQKSLRLVFLVALQGRKM